MNLFNNSQKSFFRHLLLWVGIWVFFVYFFSYNSENVTYVLAFSTVLIPITAGATYIVAYFLIPKFLLTRRLLYFGIYTFFTFLLTTFITLLSLILSVAYIPGLRIDNLPPMSRNYLFILVLVYFVVALISFLKLWKHNNQTVRNNNKLRQKILEAEVSQKEQELDFLKSQIHPHFLFNTLNTIYSFALKQSKDTPEVILKLSNLLDYILYQVKKPSVSLLQEINHIRNYVELEKIRFKDSLQISFNIENENDDLQIAPMLLLPFVENAFKHGSFIDDQLFVEIQLRTSANKLHFSVKNSSDFKAFESGIGLENIKKRLQIIYPEKHILNVKPNDNFFYVELTINHHESLAYDAYH